MHPVSDYRGTGTVSLVDGVNGRRDVTVSHQELHMLEVTEGSVVGSQPSLFFGCEGLSLSWSSERTSMTFAVFENGNRRWSPSSENARNNSR